MRCAAPSTSSARWPRAMRVARARIRSYFASASTSAISSSTRTIFSATASMSRRGSKVWHLPVESCVSRIVRDQVRDKLGLGFEDMGERRVKNIARPLHVFRIPLDDPTPAVSVTKPDHARRERFTPGPLALTFSLFVAVGTVLFFVKFAPWLGGANYSTAAQPSRMIGDAVFFDKDKVVLSRSAGSTIDRQAAFLRENPKITVTIKAYCSQ